MFYIGIRYDDYLVHRFFVIDASNGNVGIGAYRKHSEKPYVVGDFEANGDIGGKVGNFIKGIMINPPAKPNKTLVHACLEGPE